MASSFLSPPNFHALSDRVIGGVVQRTGHSRLGRTNKNETREVAGYTKPRPTLSFGDADSHSPAATDQLPPRSTIGQKRLPDLDSLADLATNRTPSVAHAMEYGDLTPPTTGRKMKVSSSRRERCRINQARYRKRQRQYADNLDEGIRTLQDEIQNLETQRQNIFRRAPTSESVWVVATEYFRVFRYGYMAPVKVPGMPIASSSTLSNTSRYTPRPQQQSHAQLDFLNATMAPDVTDGNVCGAEALLENWKRGSRFNDDVHVQLKRLEQMAADSLLASTVTSVTITASTLRQVFPHLVTAEEGEGNDQLSSLGAKLLNQRLTLRGSVHFDWDASIGRVVRLESKVDLMTPMLELLGSLEDVARVFDKALVTLEGRFIARKGENGTSTSN
ncbi:hypothetical protein PHYPSEUDO_003593 [Phytophthora pseudosyringae]|uniref:BZIP domain-containing protein n=1 Tax=Phytophthora pseudosyringae TaxID=221518 RepID=A0A8T1VU74_9STRA|nr:hypothetical protein PHYPSEUDO_003593 [Phytophthora pseudosyringae]